MKPEEYIHMFIETPCGGAVEWLESQNSLQEAWNNCDRGDWLWWALRASDNMPSKKTSVQFANWCATRAKKHNAYSAAYAADSAAYAATDQAAAFAAKLQAQADWIGEHIKFPFEKEDKI